MELLPLKKYSVSLLCKPGIIDEFILIFVFIILFLLNLTSCSTLSNPDNKKLINPATLAISFYQNYISPTDGHRCRMYPSCSEYSRRAFYKHGAIKGWILTSDRLLRCGRDEISVSAQIEINGIKYCDDPLENNDFWWCLEDSVSGSM